MRTYTRKQIVEAINYWRKQKMLLEGNDSTFKSYQYIYFDNKKDEMVSALKKGYETLNDKCEIYLKYTSTNDEYYNTTNPIQRFISLSYCDDGMLLCSTDSRSSRKADLSNVFGTLYTKFNTSFSKLTSMIFVDSQLKTFSELPNLQKIIINSIKDNNAFSIRNIIERYNRLCDKHDYDKIRQIYYLSDISFDDDKNRLVFTLSPISDSEDLANSMNVSYNTGKGLGFLGDSEATAKGIGLDDSESTTKGIGLDDF